LANWVKTAILRLAIDPQGSFFILAKVILLAEVWFFDQVLTTIQKYRMISKGDRVLVAVSGGPDSVALLHFLKQIEPLYNLYLHVFHLNHKIRGEEADEDAEFVQEYSSKLGIPSTLMSYDVPSLMKEEKLSLEEAAREARYRLLERLVAEIKANKVALGHHADDQIETFLMRLIRGAGLEGLGSILPVRGHYIRPFIEVTKQDIMQYIENNGLKFRIDASNEDLSILRNRIRHELIPLLVSYNPQFKESILKTIEIIREDQAHLDELMGEVFDTLADFGEGFVRLPIQALIAQSVSVQRRLVRKCIKWAKSDLRGIEFKHIELVLDSLKAIPPKIEMELPGNIVVFTEYDWFAIGRKQLFASPILEHVKLAVPGITKIDALGVEIEARLVGIGDLEFRKDGMVAHLDADKISGELWVRTRRTGDSFRPFGMLGEKKLQDFFVDEKVPKRERDRVPIVTQNEDIVWVAGFRIDDRYKVTEETKRVLVLALHRKT